jgi:Mrp family chromosome partitioning ATPase
LAGENVLLVDADLRRAGVSRLIHQEFSFTLRDYLYEHCTADEAIVIEESSGVQLVPAAPSDIAWTAQHLQRFFNFIDYVKHRYDIVIIDLPPVVGLAETIRLAPAADHVALVIRWGRTERQFVQSALDALRSANLSTIAVILNDIDLKSQRRRGYRDHSVGIYTDGELYRPACGYQEPARQARLPMVVAKPDNPEAQPRKAPEAQPRKGHRDRSSPGASDIEKLYDRYYRD